MGIFAPIVIQLIRYFVFAGIGFLIFYVLFRKKLKANRIQRELANSKDFKREILHSVQSSIVFGIVIILFIQTDLGAFTKVYTNLNDYPIWWIPVSVAVALVIHDTYFYWMHRLVHHPKLFRSVHLLHHKSTRPSPWTSYSFHFLEAIAESLIIPIVLSVIPMHPLAIIGFGTSSLFINVYGHLGFEIVPFWVRNTWIFQLLNTSVHHNLHHSKFNGNYGLYFRFWDRVMGTENPQYEAEFDRIQAQRKAGVGPTVSPQ